MSLYNKLFGENENATALLGMIELTRNDFERFRDIYLNKSATTITVLTRIGGKYRKIYKDIFNNVRENKWYIKDFDDNYDNTYTYIQFKVPEKYQYTCKKIAPKREELTVGGKFKKEIKEAQIPGTEASKRADEIAEYIMNEIEKGNHFIEL